MADTMTLDVARYSPERDVEPSFSRYEVPLQKEWVVLDGLNYVKDRIDGTLSFRWSCRMGVCGSCGMLIDGEPKLSCATFLDYAPGPVRVEPLRHFPVVRDLAIEMTDFMNKLKHVRPWIIRQEERPLSKGEFRQTPDQLEAYRQFSMCINCMLCCSACPWSGSWLHWAGRDRAGTALQPRLPRPGSSGAHGPAVAARGHLGLHLRGGVHRGLPQARGPGGRHPAVQAQGRHGVVQDAAAATGGQ